MTTVTINSAKQEPTSGQWTASDQVFNEDEMAIVGEGGTVIGTAWPQGDDEVGKAEQLANQRLFAASKGVLSSLMHLDTILRNLIHERKINDPYINHRLHQSAEVIAKATGGAA